MKESVMAFGAGAALALYGTSAADPIPSIAIGGALGLAGSAIYKVLMSPKADPPKEKKDDETPKVVAHNDLAVHVPGVLYNKKLLAPGYLMMTSQDGRNVFMTSEWEENERRLSKQ